VGTSKEKEEKEEAKTQNVHVIAMHTQYIVNLLHKDLLTNSSRLSSP
jgi:endonuclease IV